MYHNTRVYLSLLFFSACVAYLSHRSFSFSLLIFFVTYFVLFILFEYLDIFPGWNLWSQQERTSECYDWFSHYLKKDYGYVNGKIEFDLSESIYNNDYKASTATAMNNKYDLLFKELNLAKGKKLLDCGCGTGTWIEFCKNKGVDVVGLTLSVEQQKIVSGKGMTVYIHDYRVLDKRFVKQFDAITMMGSTEHITIFSGFDQVTHDSYDSYLSLFKVLREYLKPDGKIVMTVLVQGKPESERSSVYDRLQSYVLQRHYGGFYSTSSIISQAITDNGFAIDSVKDYTKDYHWISVAEPDHFGHWWVPWHEDPLDKIGYFFKGLLTDPFLLHRWLYYGMDTWMWSLGGYQKTPLTDEQVKDAVAHLKYFVVSVPDKTSSPVNESVKEKGPLSFHSWNNPTPWDF